MSFDAELLELMPDRLGVQPGAVDGFGLFVPSGALLNDSDGLAGLRCHIEGSAKLVRDAGGNEVVSSHQVYLGSYNDLTVEGFRFQLPSGYPAAADSSGFTAISIGKERDEDGPHHEVIFLP